MSDSDFDIRDFLPYLLAMASEEASLGFQQVYKSRYGMLRTEWRVLFHLGRFGAMTARQICDRARLHKTKVSRAVAALEDKRFVRREELETDRRSEVLHLTAAGRAAFDDLVAVAARYDAALVDGVAPQDLACLKSVLRKLARLAD